MAEQEMNSEERERTRHWLASLLLQRSDAVMPRFARLYASLAARPRGWRRRFQRKLAVTTTGAALLLALAGLGAGAHYAARAAPANVITVVNGEVNVAKDGKCSLVEAINNANNTNNGQSHVDCAAGDPSGADVIQLPSGGVFSVTKSLNNYYGYTGLPLITSTITVEGNGATINRTGNKDIRFFTVVTYEDEAGDLTLNDLTLTGGREYYSGGAIYAYDATLTVNNCTITGNEADGSGGGIFATYSTVTINNSTITNNQAYGGGGIYAGYGDVVITDSTISGNEAPDSFGGGLYFSDGNMTLVNTTVTNNEAYSAAGIMVNYSSLTITAGAISGNSNDADGDGGGGLYLVDSLTTLLDVAVSGNQGGLEGGGLVVYGGSLTLKGSTLSGNEAANGGGLYAWADSQISIVNSTLSGNTATTIGGGVVVATSDVTLVNSTLSNNSAGSAGGGLNVISGSATLQRSLVAGNSAPTGREIQRTAGTVTVDSHNLFGFGGNAGLNGLSAGATDLVPGAALAAVLGPLADNTGLTRTHALPPGSPAIDAAPSAACAAPPVGGLDQRGQPRNTEGNGAASANECDVGAYEYQPGGPVDTPTPTATSDVSPTPTATSTSGPSPTPTATATSGPSPTPTATATSGPSPTPDALTEKTYLPVVLNW